MNDAGLCEKVRHILQQAESDIRKLLGNSNPEEAQILNRIASRVQNADNVDGSFGDKVEALSKFYNLPDVETLEKHYQRVEKRLWKNHISQLRNDFAHSGYFKNTTDIGAIVCHLHDILLRILFKIMKYDGQYYPAVRSRYEAKGVDWVTKTTTAHELGYE